MLLVVASKGSFALIIDRTNNMKKDKPAKKEYVDDGHTIYSMDGLTEGKPKTEKANLSKKEFWAAIKAGFAVFFPKLLMVIGCFGLVALLMYFWLA